ncbi:uncharacterized protein LOC121367683 isoform X3 [Gigantopelta aegis]|uniref:uncharacterized protein LOC121367683 isoform X3 n=1 Tax=Gigantopelta aegis TaxID=1735272 RepID=UPI001B888159|nr:uncharacterized protein LOC121367683 isoform X3 [Gigantopelta aegis]
MLPILLLTLIGYVYSQQMCVHNNQDKLTADHVVTQVANYADHDRNGKITVFEIISEFVSRFDTHPPNHDGSVTKAEFRKWFEKLYKDCVAVPNHQLQ